VKEGEVVELEIPSEPEYVSVVRRAIEGIAQRMHFDDVQIEDLKVAVGEACTNAVKYGCPKDRSHGVVIRCVVKPDGLLVEVRNKVLGCSMPTIPGEPDLGKEGGLGLYLIQALMDDVSLEWKDETAIVRMVKRVSSSPAQSGNCRQAATQ
jgi:serine/threonine-protein kinase RsbW